MIPQVVLYLLHIYVLWYQWQITWMTRCWNVICRFEVIWWRLLKERLKQINAVPMLLGKLFLNVQWNQVSHHSRFLCSGPGNVNQYFRIRKIQNRYPSIIMVSKSKYNEMTADVAPWRWFVQNKEWGPPERWANSEFCWVNGDPSFGWNVTGGFTTTPFQTYKSCVLEGYLNDLPTDHPVLPGIYTHQLPRCLLCRGQIMLCKIFKAV